jgi:hypothetical protein
MSLYNTTNVNIVTPGTLVGIVGYQYSNAAQMTDSTSAGTVTIPLAGNYQIGINMSVQAPTTNDEMQSQLMINGVPSPLVNCYAMSPTGSARPLSMSAFGILNLNANDVLQIGLTDLNDPGNIVLYVAQFAVVQM